MMILSFISSFGFQCGYDGIVATHSRPLLSHAICTGLARSGNIASSANRFTFKFLPSFILAMASWPLRKRCLRLASGPGLFVLMLTKPGVFESSTLNGLPCATAQTLLVAIGRHHVEDFHFALGHLEVRVDLAGDFLAGRRIVLLEFEASTAAVDREAIDGAIAIEPVEIAFQYGGTSSGDMLKRPPQARVEESGINDLADACIAVLVEVNAVIVQNGPELA